MGATAKAQKVGDITTAVMAAMWPPLMPCAASICGTVTTANPPIRPKTELVRPMSQTGGSRRAAVIRGLLVAVSTSNRETKAGYKSLVPESRMFSKPASEPG
jgi:hypothetical protein